MLSLLSQVSKFVLQMHRWQPHCLPASFPFGAPLEHALSIQLSRPEQAPLCDLQTSYSEPPALQAALQAAEGVLFMLGFEAKLMSSLVCDDLRSVANYHFVGISLMHISTNIFAGRVMLCSLLVWQLYQSLLW